MDGSGFHVRVSFSAFYHSLHENMSTPESKKAEREIRARHKKARAQQRNQWAKQEKERTSIAKKKAAKSENRVQDQMQWINSRASAIKQEREEKKEEMFIGGIEDVGPASNSSCKCIVC